MVVKVVRLSRRVVEYSRRFRSLDRSNLAIGFVLRTIFLSRSLFVEEHFVGLAMKLSSLIISGGGVRYTCVSCRSAQAFSHSVLMMQYPYARFCPTLNVQN